MNKKIWKRSMQIIGLGIIGLMALFSIRANKSQDMKFIPTLKNTQLGLCPETPNCISSFHQENDDHYLAPRLIQNDPMLKIDEYFGDCHKNVSKENYRHFECQTGFFKFVDDIEVFYHKEENKLHYRSASRVGHSDLGKNKARILELLLFLEESN